MAPSSAADYRPPATTSSRSTGRHQHARKPHITPAGNGQRPPRTIWKRPCRSSASAVVIFTVVFNPPIATTRFALNVLRIIRTEAGECSGHFTVQFTVGIV